MVAKVHRINGDNMVPIEFLRPTVRWENNLLCGLEFVL
jgi:hypothetical protein